MAFDIKTLGGLSTGALGDITNPTGQINSYGSVSAISTDGYRLTLGYTSIGAFEAFSAGDKVLFHVSGCLSTATADKDKFLVATIVSRSGADIVLDKSVATVFTPANLSSYCCQVVTIPQFNSLTLGAGKSISAMGWDSTNKIGGILIVSTKGTADITGASLLAEGKGLPAGSSLKPAGITYSNADLKTRLPLNTGNGIVLAFGTTLNNTGSVTTTRIGASWTGAGAGGLGGTIAGSTTPPNAGGPGTSAKGGDGGYYGATPALAGGPAGYSGLNGYNGVLGGKGGATVALCFASIVGFIIDMFSTGGDGGDLVPGGGSPTDGNPGGAGFGGGGGPVGGTYGQYGSSGGGPGYGLICTNTTLTANTTAYALDTLVISKTSLLTTTAGLDFTSWTEVNAPTVTGVQPANTDRRFAFKAAISTAGSRTYPISTNAVAADTVTVGGVTFTAIASGATGNQFNVGASTTATATNLAAVLNANATISALYTATASTNVVTLTEKTAGGGNTPGAATKTGTIVIDAGTVVTAVPTAGGYYKLTGSGAATLSPLPTQAITAASVLSEGNTAAELAAVTGITAFVGKVVYPAIALTGPGDGSAIPSIKLSIAGKCNTDTVSKTFESGEIVLSKAGDVNLINAVAQTNVVGAGAVQTLVAAKSSSGTWSSFVPLAQANTLRGSSINMRAVCTVPSVGSGASATVNAVTVRHRSNDAAVSGQTAEVVMLTDDFSSGLPNGATAAMRGVRALLKHDGFRDAGAKAWCSFRSQPKTRERIPIGVGDAAGTRLTMILGVDNVRDTGINHNTLQVWFGNTPVDIDYNTEVSECYGTPPDGVTAFASYSYGWEPEVWVQMTEGQTTPYDAGGFATDYSYTIPGNASKAVGCVKFELDKPVGSLTNYSLGTVTGKQQMVYVPHKLRREAMAITPSAGTVVWTYDDDSGIITLVGSSAGATMTLAADYTAETPVATGIVAAYVEGA